MEITAFKLPATSLYSIVDELRNHVASLKYLNGRVIFGRDNVSTILAFPHPNQAPTKEGSPRCSIVIDSEMYSNRTIQTYSPTVDVTVSLLLYYYDFDNLGIEERRAQLTRYIVNSLEKPSTIEGEEASLLSCWRDNPRWQFDNEREIFVEHTNVLRRYTETVVLSANWYASRIELPIKNYNV
jgi:hypothetical protein